MRLRGLAPGEEEVGMCRRLLVGAVSVAAVMAFGSASAQAGALSVHVLSNRADLISGGQALASVALPRAVNPGAVTVALNGSNVTNEFAMRPNGSYEGLVTGLRVGSNVLKAEAPASTRSQITIVDHAIGGPVFSGPQIKPWVCKNANATDAQCDAPTSYAYEYKSSITGQFEAYDSSKPPSDVETTTTDNGDTVPFIIRIETGYQDRDQYQIAVLFQPGKPWEAWAPQPQFDHKLLITHGASCGIDH